LENQGNREGDPNGVVGTRGVVGALEGVTACSVVSLVSAAERFPVLEVSVSAKKYRKAVFTDHIASSVHKTGMDKKIRMGTQKGKINKRTNEATELSHAKLLVWKTRGLE
jgi:hypothetical protein